MLWRGNGKGGLSWRGVAGSDRGRIHQGCMKRLNQNLYVSMYTNDHTIEYTFELLYPGNRLAQKPWSAI